jgi:hypothetical protein
MARSARLAVIDPCHCVELRRQAEPLSAAVAIESPPPVGGAQPGGEPPPTGNTGPPRGELPPAPVAARIAGWRLRAQANKLKKIRVVAGDAAKTLPTEVKR